MWLHSEHTKHSINGVPIGYERASECRVLYVPHTVSVGVSMWSGGGGLETRGPSEV